MNMIYLDSFHRRQFINKFWSSQKSLRLFVDVDVFKQRTVKQRLQYTDKTATTTDKWKAEKSTKC